MQERKGKTIIWNGKRYYKAEYNPYWRLQFSKKARYLHRDVWEFFNGPIPEGWQVHHKDKDTDNNDIENLECCSPKNHKTHHPNTHKPNQKAHEEAAKWHRSEEGRRWHEEHGGRKYFPIYITQECIVCHKTFTVKNRGETTRKTCSNSCAGVFRYRNKISRL